MIGHFKGWGTISTQDDAENFFPACFWNITLSSDVWVAHLGKRSVLIVIKFKTMSPVRISDDS